jgi:hypothetical protein
MKKVIAALITFAAIALPQSAIAQTTNFTSPHKWTDAATNKSYVFIPNQTPLVAIPNLISRNESGDESVRLNNCGWGSIDYFVTLVHVVRYNQPGFINWGGRTTGATPSCTQNASGVWVSNNNSPVGTVVKAGSKYWIKGGNSWGSISVTLSYGKVIKNKVNACGFLRVLLNDSQTMTNFTVGMTDYTLAGIPMVTKPMICRKVGSSNSTYLPLN